MRGVVGIALVMGGVGLAFLVLIDKFPPAAWNPNALMGATGTEGSFKDIGNQAGKVTGDHPS